MIGNIVLIINQDYAIIEEMSRGGISSHQAEMRGGGAASEPQLGNRNLKDAGPKVDFFSGE